MCRREWRWGQYAALKLKSSSLASVRVALFWGCVAWFCGEESGLVSKTEKEKEKVVGNGRVVYLIKREWGGGLMEEVRVMEP